jgi:pimeloyl-ACP methyl ester carboxylesterase
MEITHRVVETNGIRMHAAEAGRGPLVVLCHGFPESWYSWRHQLIALAQAGYHAVAPDQRGYGQTTAPEPIEHYTLLHLVGDIVGLVDALGEKTAVIAGHDWGAPVAWHTALLHPRRVRAVAGLSVPYTRGRVGTMTRQENFGDNFWYWVYFQQPGVAEAELEADLRKSLRMIYFVVSGDIPEEMRPVKKPATAKFLDGMTDPERFPSWVTEEDLDYYVAQYQQSGFRGPLNWYRNIDRNIEITPQLETAKIEQPSFFIAGNKDPVLSFGRGNWVSKMDDLVTDMRGKVFIEGAGHWVQMERPAEVNEALLGFLKSVS